MSTLQKLAEVTKCSFHLEYNPHKSFYDDPRKYLAELGNGDGFYDEVGELDYNLDIWTIQVYPRTPVGFIAGVSNSLDDLINWAVEGAKDY